MPYCAISYYHILSYRYHIFSLVLSCFNAFLIFSLVFPRSRWPPAFRRSIRPWSLMPSVPRHPRHFASTFFFLPRGGSDGSAICQGRTNKYCLSSWEFEP